MVGKEITVWGIHAGRHSEGDTLFLSNNCIAIGWKEVGDVSAVPATREAFKKVVSKAYPHIDNTISLATNAGQLYRFIHELKEGDTVLYPSRIDKHIHFGKVMGPYEYVEGAIFPQQRPVKWYKSVPRTSFSQEALWETGAALTFFQVKNNTDEFMEALKGKTVSTRDDVSGPAPEEIEQTTRDFVLKRLTVHLHGHPLEHFVSNVLETMGYRSKVTKKSGDGGVDIIAHRDELGLEPPIIKVQVKSGQGTIGDPEVSQLYGKVDKGEVGLFVSLGAFSKAARAFENTKSNLKLIDGYDFVGLVLDHYEELDPKYKAMIPLKRVFVPEPMEEPEAE